MTFIANALTSSVITLTIVITREWTTRTRFICKNQKVVFILLFFGLEIKEVTFACAWKSFKPLEANTGSCCIITCSLIWASTIPRTIKLCLRYIIKCKETSFYKQLNFTKLFTWAIRTMSASITWALAWWSITYSSIATISWAGQFWKT